MSKETSWTLYSSEEKTEDYIIKKEGQIIDGPYLKGENALSIYFSSFNLLSEDELIILTQVTNNASVDDSFSHDKTEENTLIYIAGYVCKNIKGSRL